MTNTPISLQDLRRNLYVKAKSEPSWRFWGLYVHVCKMETLREAYEMARKNNGAPGIDGVTFEAVEAYGVESFIEQIRGELINRTYVPLRSRKQEIPKAGGKFRTLSIPAIRDRVVQGALKLIMEPIFEADFQPGSYGYRPKKTAHQAVQRVAKAIVQYKTHIIDLDLKVDPNLRGNLHVFNEAGQAQADKPEAGAEFDYAVQYGWQRRNVVYRVGARALSYHTRNTSMGELVDRNVGGGVTFDVRYVFGRR